MPPDRMTPMRVQDTDQQHNRSAKSSVNGTIVLLGNKAGQNTGEQPTSLDGWEQSWVELQYTARNNTRFVEALKYIIVVSKFYID